MMVSDGTCQKQQQEDQNMEAKRLNTLLEDGEQILWAGRPDPGKFMDGQNRRYNTRWFIITGAIFAAILIALAAGTVRSQTGFFNVFTLFILLIGAVVIASPYSAYRKLRKVVYAVTNRRILVSSSETSRFVLDLDMADSVSVLPGDGQNATLCIGSPTAKIKPHKLRDCGSMGFRFDKDNGSLVYPVFYNIPEAEKVKEIIQPRRQEVVSAGK